MRKKAKPTDSVIYFLLDTSGSMAYTWSDTMGALRSYIDEQIKAGSNADFVLATFDTPTNFKIVYDGPITSALGVTDGLTADGPSTALLDATMKAIKELKSADYSKRQLVTMTDGQENSSVEYRGKANIVRETLDGARNQGIDVVALAVGPDSWANDQIYGIHNTVRAVNTGKSIDAGISYLSSRSMAYNTSADVTTFATTTSAVSHVDANGNISDDDGTV